MTAQPHHSVISAAVPATRLGFLDSLRALAALSVVALHAFQIYGHDLASIGIVNSTMALGDGALDRMLLLSYSLLWRWGTYAVPVFIVLSGFSLMIPVARNPALALKDGTRGFLWRRARRILPPYYAALILAGLLTLLVPAMGVRQGFYWDIALPAFTPEVLASRILLVQNMPWSDDPLFGMRLNPPLWTIAVESQIYLLFPLLLVLWRRIGAPLTMLIAMVVGVGQAAFGLRIYPLSNGHYLGLFALGMLAAVLAFRSPNIGATGRTWPWLSGALGFSLFFLVAHVLKSVPVISSHWMQDLLLGTAVASFLVYGSLHNSNARLAARPFWLALLDWKPLVAMGERSYSIYLVHAPVLALVAVLLTGFSPALAAMLVFLIGIPASVAVASLFFVFIERPFINQPLSKTPRAAQPLATIPTVAAESRMEPSKRH